MMHKDEWVDGLLERHNGKDDESTPDEARFPRTEDLPSEIRANTEALAALDRVLERDGDRNEPPGRIGEFEIIGELGRGGM